MRDWMTHEAALTEAGGVLYVLTSDEPRALRGGLRKHRLSGTFVPVAPALWAQWGLANPRKRKVPHPTTLVVNPDGTVLLRETHEDYTERTPPALVVERVRASRVAP